MLGPKMAHLFHFGDENFPQEMGSHFFVFIEPYNFMLKIRNKKWAFPEKTVLQTEGRAEFLGPSSWAGCSTTRNQKRCKIHFLWSLS